MPGSRSIRIWDIVRSNPGKAGTKYPAVHRVLRWADAEHAVPGYTWRKLLSSWLTPLTLTLTISPTPTTINVIRDPQLRTDIA